MKYAVLLNGTDTVEGDTSAEVVAQLRRLEFSLTNESTSLPFMERVQGRIKELYRLDIRMCCCEHFLEDLCEAGAIKRIEGGQ